MPPAQPRHRGHPLHLGEFFPGAVLHAVGPGDVGSLARGEEAF